MMLFTQIHILLCKYTITNLKMSKCKISVDCEPWQGEDVRGASKAKMGKYQQKPAMPKRPNPNDIDAAKEKWDAVAAEVFAATMVSSSARAANLGAASGQDSVDQLAGQVESFIQLMFFSSKR